MNSISATAVSGMMAATQRLAVSARNVANASGAASPRTPVDQVEISGGGAAPQVASYRPATPEGANAPDIDLATEAVDQLSANLAFAANVAVLRTYNQMNKSLLNVMA